MEGDSAQQDLLKEAAEKIRADNKTKEDARPKTVGAGAMGLVGDSLSGVAVGAAAIVMGPVAGYKEGGATGMLKGAVGGLCVGVASAAIGIGSGVVKLVDGASAQASDKNLPAIEAAPADQNARDKYAREKSQMYDGVLGDEHASASGNANANGTKSWDAKPTDTELYDVLGITPDATPKQIRRAYFAAAQRWHPDKNLDDPTATAKFQRISDAYQVLSDPVKRERYHRLGKDAGDEEGLLDPKSLFALMFGNDKFDHLVGDLATSTLLNSEKVQDDGTPNPEAESRRKEFQQYRIQKLATLLKKRLEPWENGNKQLFLDHARLEIQVLRSEPFGADILHTVGYVYRKKAALALGKGKGPLGIKGFFSELSDKAHMIRSKVEAIEGGMRAAQSVQEVPDDDEEPETAARRQSVKVLGAVWLASVVDIQSTLRKVCKEVLAQDGITKGIMKSRAEGLSQLGKLFQQA